MLFLAVGASAFAQPARIWQLTFSYSPQGLVLTKAAPIESLRAGGRAPGLNGAPLVLDFHLEWLNAAGETVRQSPVKIPLGLRSTLPQALGVAAAGVTVPDSGVFVVRVEGPAEAAMAHGIRLRRDGVSAGLVGTPPAFDFVEQVFPLTSGAERSTALASPPVFTVGPMATDKVRDTGPDPNRLVLVIMGDGYTAADLASGAFSNQVSRFIQHLIATSPWSTYRDAVNIYRVDVVSRESGADFEDASPASGGTLKDTYLDAQFWAGGQERCVYLSSAGVARAYAAADAAVGAGMWDEILVFVNSPKYGGCGGAVGVASVHASADEIQVHELGHSFGSLSDEYDYGGSGTNCVATAVRNVDCGLHFPQVKWSAWVEPGTPLPTPETAEFAGRVGAFEGAMYQSAGIYRPMLDCKMQSLGAPFCAVCQEAHVLKLFERVDLLDEVWPPPGYMEVLTDTPRVFTVNPIPVAGLTYRWTLGGAEIPGATNASVTIASAQVTSTNLELRVEATHATPQVRAQLIQAQRVWQLTVVDSPSLAIADAVVTEGDEGTAQVTLTVTLSSPSSSPVTVDFASADGTATAEGDYVPCSGQLSFAPGETRQSVHVAVVGDVIAEANETFFIQLTNSAGASLQDGQATVVMVDNDHLPSAGIASPAPGTVFSEDTAVLVAVDTGAASNFVAHVEVFQDGAAWFDLVTPPYALPWSNAVVGLHTLTAVVTDQWGRRATSAPVRVTVLPYGVRHFALLRLTNAWRFDATTNDYGSAWKESAFDDSGWRGPSNALFYSGNLLLAGPKRTPLPLSANGTRLRSYYFRTHFVFPESPTASLALVASNLVDDGAVFYLNGREAGRLRMPPDDITRTNFALPGGLATSFDVLTLDAGSLQPGDNVLAAELHLASETSGFLAFGLSLDAYLTNRVNQPPVLNPVADALVNEGSWLDLRITATDPDGPGQALSFTLETAGSSSALLTPDGLFRWKPEIGHLPTTNAFTLRVTDAGTPPLSATQSFRVIVNHLPVPASPLLERYAGAGLKVREHVLLGTDPDGDGLGIAAVSAVSLQGGTVRISEGWVLYTPPPGQVQPDFFGYTVGDGRGAFSLGTATILVASNQGPSLNLTSERLTNGAVLLRGDGLPHQLYGIEFTERLDGPVWKLLGTAEADAFGCFSYLDHPPAGVPARFYRSLYPRP